MIKIESENRSKIRSSLVEWGVSLEIVLLDVDYFDELNIEELFLQVFVGKHAGGGHEQHHQPVQHEIGEQQGEIMGCEIVLPEQPLQPFLVKPFPDVGYASFFQTFFHHRCMLAVHELVEHIHDLLSILTYITPYLLILKYDVSSCK